MASDLICSDRMASKAADFEDPANSFHTVTVLN